MTVGELQMKLFEFVLERGKMAVLDLEVGLITDSMTDCTSLYVIEDPGSPDSLTVLAEF